MKFLSSIRRPDDKKSIAEYFCVVWSDAECAELAGPDVATRDPVSKAEPSVDSLTIPMPVPMAIEIPQAVMGLKRELLIDHGQDLATATLKNNESSAAFKVGRTVKLRGYAPTGDDICTRRWRAVFIRTLHAESTSSINKTKLRQQNADFHFCQMQTLPQLP
ncbi:hypothetical protein E4U41_001568 [Claviceps citrina]|nr:hypothetical protein E4U41_001568 [Claviceps citrina]